MEIFANSVSDVNNLRLGHDLPISVNDRVISAFLRGRGLFSRNFAYAKFRENKTLAKVSDLTVVCVWRIAFSLENRVAPFLEDAFV